MKSTIKDVYRWLQSTIGWPHSDTSSRVRIDDTQTKEIAEYSLFLNRESTRCIWNICIMNENQSETQDFQYYLIDIVKWPLPYWIFLLASWDCHEPLWLDNSIPWEKPATRYWTNDILLNSIQETSLPGNCINKNCIDFRKADLIWNPDQPKSIAYRDVVGVENTSDHVYSWGKEYIKSIANT